MCNINYLFKIFFVNFSVYFSADIQTYLLEKSRLIHQEPNERYDLFIHCYTRILITLDV